MKAHKLHGSPVALPWPSRRLFIIMVLLKPSCHPPVASCRPPVALRSPFHHRHPPVTLPPLSCRPPSPSRRPPVALLSPPPRYDHPDAVALTVFVAIPSHSRRPPSPSRRPPVASPSLHMVLLSPSVALPSPSCRPPMALPSLCDHPSISVALRRPPVALPSPSCHPPRKRFCYWKPFPPPSPPGHDDCLFPPTLCQYAIICW